MHETETIIQALYTLFARLETLRTLTDADVLLPDRKAQYERMLEEAYAALAQVEAALDELGQELEAQHQRLGQMEDYDAQDEQAPRVGWAFPAPAEGES